MIKFEKVKKYKDVDFDLPKRKTKYSAGYDFVVPESIIIPSHLKLLQKLEEYYSYTRYNNIDLNTISNITKQHDIRPTLVPTGVKCYLEENQYLELSIRSSIPLKAWIILGNGNGIIDSDYVDNSDNEGHIFFQVINLSPFPIKLNKGDIIGQGIIKQYLKTDDDLSTDIRDGGFGSTTKS